MAMETKKYGCPGFSFFWDDIREYAECLSSEQMGNVIKTLYFERIGKKYKELDQAELMMYVHLKYKIVEQEEKYRETVEQNKANIQKRYSKKDAEKEMSISSNSENSQNAQKQKRKYTRRKPLKTAENKDSENLETGSYTAVYEGIAIQTQTQTQNKNSLPSNAPSPEGLDKGKSEGEEAFTKFRQLYPKKSGLAAAEPYFYEALKEIAPEKLFALLERQKLTPDWQRESGRYVPAAEKWLREKCWLDVPEDPYDRYMREAEEAHKRELESLEKSCADNTCPKPCNSEAGKSIQSTTLNFGGRKPNRSEQKASEDGFQAHKGASPSEVEDPYDRMMREAEAEHRRELETLENVKIEV